MTPPVAATGAEDWPMRRLDELGRCLRGVGYDPDRHLVSRDRRGTVRLLRANNVQDSALDLTDIQRVVESCVAPDQFMRAGDVLICAANGNKALVGKAAAFASPDSHRYTFGAFMTCFRPDPSQLDPQFAAYLLQSNGYRAQVMAALAGSSINNLGPTQIKAMTFAVPDLWEQAVIVGVLADMDRLLSSLSQLIAKIRDLRRAISQQLLTARTRLPGFEGEWLPIRLGDIGTFSKGRGIRRDELRATGVPCVLYGEVYTHHNDYIRAFRSFIPREVAQSSTRLRKGDLLFTASGETTEEIGKCVAFLDDFEAYAGGDIVILRSAGQDAMYVGYLMNDPIVTKQKARLGQGDVVAHISAASLAQIEVRLPRSTEQRAIAAVLSDVDREIDLLERRLLKTRALKEAIAHELLSGRVRIVPAGAEVVHESVQRRAETVGVAPAVA